MDRRNFLRSAFAISAAGLLIQEWLLDPPKSRSMVTVPEFRDMNSFVGRNIIGIDGQIRTIVDYDPHTRTALLGMPWRTPPGINDSLLLERE